MHQSSARVLECMYVCMWVYVYVCVCMFERESVCIHACVAARTKAMILLVLFVCGVCKDNIFTPFVVQLARLPPCACFVHSLSRNPQSFTLPARMDSQSPPSHPSDKSTPPASHGTRKAPTSEYHPIVETGLLDLSSEMVWKLVRRSG